MTPPSALTPGALDEIERLRLETTRAECPAATPCTTDCHTVIGCYPLYQAQCEYDEALHRDAPALIASARELERVKDRITTIADEATGPHPVQSVEESLTCIERGFVNYRRTSELWRAERDAALADLAKAREELAASRKDYITLVDAVAAETSSPKHAADIARNTRRERDDWRHRYMGSTSHVEQLERKLAALEARAADAPAYHCRHCGKTWAQGVAAPDEWQCDACGGCYSKDAPAAPAKADDAWMSRALDGPEIRDDAHADAILAEAGIDPVKALAKTMEMVERYELAAQLAEAVGLLRDLSEPFTNATAYYERQAEEFYRDTHLMAPGKSAPLGMYSEADDERRHDEWRRWGNERAEKARARITTFLAAIDAGRARAT